MACLKGGGGSGGSRREVCFEQGVCFEMQGISGTGRSGEKVEWKIGLQAPQFTSVAAQINRDREKMSS